MVAYEESKLTAVSPKQLALLQAQLSAARISAQETGKSISYGSDQTILPFLHSCAKDLEETARLIRASADAAAAPTPSGCS